MDISGQTLTDARTLSSLHVLRSLPLTAAVLDALVVLAAVSIAGMLRNRGFFFDSLADVPDIQLVALLVALAWVALIALRGGYQQEIFGAGMDEYKRVVSASALAAGAVGITCYLLNYPLLRGFYVLAFVIGVPGLLLARFILRKLLQRARRQGHLRQRVLVVGRIESIDEVARVLQRETWLGYEVLGALTPVTELTEETPSGVPVLANADEAARMAVALQADLVLFAGGGVASSTQMRRLLWALESAKIHVVVVPSMTDIARERITTRPLAGLPLVYVRGPSTLDASRWAKRTFDVVGSIGLLALTMPILVATALLIKLHDGGPVLFRHKRVGMEGREFHCLKFRTMVVNADQLLERLIEDRGASALLFKAKDDPRITAPGQWLRKFSLDELPQLLNVLRGDMSLVGPRPQVANEVAHYDDFMSRRLRVRPGMTGLWQVSGRNDLDLADAIRLDLYYVDNWSMVQDLIILAKTFRAVTGGRGAY